MGVIITLFVGIVAFIFGMLLMSLLIIARDDAGQQSIMAETPLRSLTPAEMDALCGVHIDDPNDGIEDDDDPWPDSGHKPNTWQ